MQYVPKNRHKQWTGNKELINVGLMHGCKFIPEH